MSKAGHLSVRQGKRVKVHLENGDTLIAKFKERKGRYVLFFDHNPIRTSEITTLTIYKG